MPATQLATILTLALAFPAFGDSAPAVTPGPGGKLVYTAGPRGDTIPDFSNCGYRGGGVALPAAAGIPVKATLNPVPGSGDDGARIQAAVDEVGKLPADDRGIRGAVLLTRGAYRVAASIKINHAGVILRGEGDGENGTILIATGADRRALVSVGGSAAEADDDDEVSPKPKPRAKPAAATNDKKNARAVSDAYVPVGAHAFNVDDIAGFKVGDPVIVHRPSTENWIHEIAMDRIPPNKGGRKINQWTPGSKDLDFERVVTAIDGKRITLDAPIVCALDAQYGGGSVYHAPPPTRLRECGVERIRGVSEFKGDTDEDHSWTFIRLAGVENGWVRHVTAVHFASNCVALSNPTKWCTIQDSSCLDPVSQVTGGRRYSFSMNRCQLCLVQRCFGRNGRHDFVMGSAVPGPNAFVDCKAEQTHADIGPHQRWSVGVLWDNIVAPDGQINIRDRGAMGSGHGWAGANQVVWNSVAKSMIVANPPTAQNWAIGCTTGKQVGNGEWQSFGKRVEPRSLYLAQLKDRLGPQAVANVSKEADK